MIEFPTDWQPNDKLLKFINETLASGEPFAWLFVGFAGRGKTAVASLVFAELEKQYRNSWFLSAKNVYDKYLKAINCTDTDKSVKVANAMSYFGSDLFLLDDLGRETDTPASRAYFAGLFSDQNDAYEDGKLNRCIVTTNLVNFKEIEARYGEAIMSRIYGNYNIVRFNGKQDYRMLKKQVVDV